MLFSGQAARMTPSMSRMHILARHSVTRIDILMRVPVTKSASFSAIVGMDESPHRQKPLFLIRVLTTPPSLRIWIMNGGRGLNVV